jgi:hypothetical protein
MGDGSARDARAVATSVSLEALVAAAARQGVRMPAEGAAVVMLDLPQSAAVGSVEVPLAYEVELPRDPWQVDLAALLGDASAGAAALLGDASAGAAVELLFVVHA